HLRALPTIPTRRSSDLLPAPAWPGDVGGTRRFGRQPEPSPGPTPKVGGGVVDGCRMSGSPSTAVEGGRPEPAPHPRTIGWVGTRSEEHTSELQSRGHLV